MEKEKNKLSRGKWEFGHLFPSYCVFNYLSLEFLSQYFENVTVMFSYLDGFVAICSQVDAMEVVNLVNNMFTSFDKLTEKHDVYKVKSLIRFQVVPA